MQSHCEQFKHCTSSVISEDVFTLALCSFAKYVLNKSRSISENGFTIGTELTLRVLGFKLASNQHALMKRCKQQNVTTDRTEDLVGGS